MTAQLSNFTRTMSFEAGGDDILMIYTQQYNCFVLLPIWILNGYIHQVKYHLMTEQVCCNEASPQTHLDPDSQTLITGASPPPIVGSKWGLKFCQIEFHESFQWSEIEISMNSFPLYFR